MAVIGLHKSTGDDKYLQWLNSRGGELIRSLKNQYNAKLNTYNLTGRTNGQDVAASPTPGTVDTPHASDAFSFLSHAKLEGYDLGGEFDDVVLNRVVNTLSSVIFKEDRFTANVDGSESGILAVFADNNGGFARLAVFNNDLLDRYARYVTAESTYASGVVSFENRIHTLGSVAFALAYKGQ